MENTKKVMALLLVGVILAVLLPGRAYAAVNPNVEAFSELDGGAGYINVQERYSLDIEETDLFEKVYDLQNGIANMLFTCIRWLGWVTIMLFYQCMNFDLAQMFHDQIREIQSTLNSGIFQPMFVLGFCGSAALMIQKMYKRDAMGLAGQIIKVVGIVILSVLVVRDSATVLSVTTGFTKELGTQALVGMQTGEGVTTSSFAAQAAGTLWCNLVHDPWVFLEFSGEDPGGYEFAVLDTEPHSDERRQLVEDFGGSDAFRMESAESRVGFLIFYLIPFLLKCAAYIAMALLSLGIQLVALFYVMMAPVVLILAMIPGYEGMLTGWLRKILESQLSLLVMFFVVGLLIKFDNMLYAACAGAWGWLVVLVVQAILSVFVILKRQELLRGLSNIKRSAVPGAAQRRMAFEGFLAEGGLEAAGRSSAYSRYRNMQRYKYAAARTIAAAGGVHLPAGKGGGGKAPSGEAVEPDRPVSKPGQTGSGAAKAAQGGADNRAKTSRDAALGKAVQGGSPQGALQGSGSRQEGREEKYANGRRIGAVKSSYGAYTGVGVPVARPVAGNWRENALPEETVGEEIRSLENMWGNAVSGGRDWEEVSPESMEEAFLPAAEPVWEHGAGEGTDREKAMAQEMEKPTREKEELDRGADDAPKKEGRSAAQIEADPKARNIESDTVADRQRELRESSVWDERKQERPLWGSAVKEAAEERDTQNLDGGEEVVNGSVKDDREHAGWNEAGGGERIIRRMAESVAGGNGMQTKPSPAAGNEMGADEMLQSGVGGGGHASAGSGTAGASVRSVQGIERSSDIRAMAGVARSSEAKVMSGAARSGEARGMQEAARSTEERPEYGSPGDRGKAGAENISPTVLGSPPQKLQEQALGAPEAPPKEDKLFGGDVGEAFEEAGKESRDRKESPRIAAAGKPAGKIKEQILVKTNATRTVQRHQTGTVGDRIAQQQREKLPMQCPRVSTGQEAASQIGTQ